MTFRNLLLSLFLLLSVVTASVVAQTLPRRGWLGVGAKPLDDATAAAAKIKVGDGLAVTLVVPGGTFDTMGVKVGDIVLKINDRAIATPAALISAAQSLTEGDALTAEVIAGDKRSILKGVAKGRPRETSPNADVRYDAVEMSLGTLRTITLVPKNATGKLPAVFYVQGFPCESQDFPPGSADPRKQAFEDWARAGFVVFRVERPNLGDSRTSKDCRDIDFDEELAVNIAGYKKLLGFDFVDNDKIFFFAHSMGAVTAPYIAQHRQPRGILAYGLAIRSWFEYFIDIERVQQTYTGLGHVGAEKLARDSIPFLYDWLERGLPANELRAKYPQLTNGAESNWTLTGDYFNGRSTNFWHTMNKRNLVEAWSKVESKVISMYGEFDVQAINSRDAVMLAETINQSHPGNGEFMLVPGTEHVFLKMDSHRKVFELIGSGKYFEYGATNYNPEIGRITVEWMKKKM